MNEITQMVRVYNARVVQQWERPGWPTRSRLADFLEDLDGATEFRPGELILFSFLDGGPRAEYNVLYRVDEHGCPHADHVSVFPPEGQ